jgi:sulfur carrier protein
MTTATNIRITLNGEPRALPPGTTVDGLVGDLGLRSDVVAVELNERLVARTARTSTVLRDGDRLEVVTLVGGG